MTTTDISCDKKLSFVMSICGKSERIEFIVNLKFCYANELDLLLVVISLRKYKIELNNEFLSMIFMITKLESLMLLVTL